MSLIEKFKNGISAIAGGLSTLTLFPDSNSYDVSSNPYLSETNSKRSSTESSITRVPDDSE